MEATANVSAAAQISQIKVIIYSLFKINLVKVPVLESIIFSSFLSGNNVFNHPLSFPMLTSLEMSVGVGGLPNVFNNTISFDKWVVGNQSGLFGSASASTNFITAEFRAVQNVATLSGSTSSIWFRYRDTDNTTHNYVHLRIRQGSANVNVANKTWAGHTFASVTLIDEFGNAV